MVESPAAPGRCPLRKAAPPVAFALALLFGVSSASAVRREVVRDLQDEFGGRSFQLRVDLQRTNYFSAANVLDARGLTHQGRTLATLFLQMETVFLERVVSDGGKSVALTVYRNRDEAQRIRGAVPGQAFPVGGDLGATMGNFARDLSTTVVLEVAAEKSDPDAQQRQFLELLDRLFYMKTAPTYEEKEAFITAHRTLPLGRLTEITGLSDEVVRGILKKTEPE